MQFIFIFIFIYFVLFIFIIIVNLQRFLFPLFFKTCFDRFYRSEKFSKSCNKINFFFHAIILFLFRIVSFHDNGIV